MEALLLILGSMVWLLFTLVQKAGYGTVKSLLMGIGLLVPLVNLGILVYLASATWPIEVELAALRRSASVVTKDHARALLSAAMRSERQGRVGAAIANYEEIIRLFPGSEWARDADASIRSLKAKLDLP